MPVCRSLTHCGVVRMLLLLFAATAIASAAVRGMDEIDPGTPITAAYTDGTAYGTDEPLTSRAFVQPAPIVLTVLYEHVSRGHAHTSADAPPFTGSPISAAHIAGRSSAVEVVCLNCEGRHRHRRLLTFRC